MTPKPSQPQSPTRSSALVHCNTFGEALVVLAKIKQLKNNQKLEDVLKEIPLTMRNWRRITLGETVPNIISFHGLRRSLCGASDCDIFDAMYIEATQEKARFSETDLIQLIKFATGVECNRRDTVDPNCFREIAFSRMIKLSNAETGKKAIAFFRTMRGLLVSKRLPARSDQDRELRVAIMMYREALAARVMNNLTLQADLIKQIESLDIRRSSAFIQGSLIDLKALATNSPDEIFFEELDKPIIDAQISSFTRVLKLYAAFDGDSRDPLREYGFTSTTEDAEVNILRLAALYGRDEAAHALDRLAVVQAKDNDRGASRSLTFYNDLVRIEAFISMERTSAARDL
ncbi:MAG: hypothetical protein HOO99_05040, partial [Hyphomicrobiaceae bacterium]|nr:hypothetical protein [Hyphomicrobiaceae bacterium]